MPQARLIARLHPETTPSAVRKPGKSRYVLGDDLLREASRRLGVLSLTGAALWVVGTALGNLAFRTMTTDTRFWVFPTTATLIASVSGAFSFGLFAYTRRTKRDPQFILDLGLVFLVLTSLALGLMLHWVPVAREALPITMISWTGVVALMFAAIIPTAPSKMLVAGLMAASMNPISMMVSRATGTWDYGPVSNAFLMHYPDYLLVGVAVVISHVVTRLGHQITRAREMGSYQLGELLGGGGMGEVYRATHRMLARPAAIKLIRPEMIAGGSDATELAVKRFRREAEAAANLRSPHTVELYDFGVTEDQTLYFVMELLEGMDLETLVRRHGLVPADRVVRILLQVCDSLEEAHSRNLVHRDIKPANIHIGRLGLRHDFVKVLDFGLVKSLTGPSTERSLETAAGFTPGTPAYMAPEMVAGEGFDGRADIYSLGCVSYFLLTGRPVFEAANVYQAIAKHVLGGPVPPSQRAGIPIPAGLERLVLQCLATNPVDRPQSAAELAQALDALGLNTWGEREAAEWWRANGSLTSAAPAGRGGEAPDPMPP